MKIKEDSPEYNTQDRNMKGGRFSLDLIFPSTGRDRQGERGLHVARKSLFPTPRKRAGDEKHIDLAFI
jgi:hypothetical protein